MIYHFKLLAVHQYLLVSRVLISGGKSFRIFHDGSCPYDSQMGAYYFKVTKKKVGCHLRKLESIAKRLYIHTDQQPIDV